MLKQVLCHYVVNQSIKETSMCNVMTNFHGPKTVRATEVLLYILRGKRRYNQFSISQTGISQSKILILKNTV